MKPVKVMINGIPGNMGINLSKFAISDNRFELVPYSLTGPEIEQSEFSIGSINIRLIKPDEKAGIIENIKHELSSFICIDFTHPSAAEGNAEFYCKHSIPFVMGTTGGDINSIQSRVKSSRISAVVAPNMAKQIVGFQAMVKWCSDTFPGLFNGYSLTIKESHQHGKADTSGTAKSMVSYFNKLGVRFSINEIEKERNPEFQKSVWKIPDKYLKGHAWHTYNLESPDKTNMFEIKHNINGRDIYTEGTFEAVLYLKNKMKAGVKGEVFSTIDMLMDTPDTV